ncbi:MAG: ATP-dependent helicase [Saprospiraceae bacterium]|nr:ATP-dependent helicase [Saprospiraceae bacterium]
MKEQYMQTWQNAYNALNENQRRAVDTIEGPVMTIAGPGTGKTQLLAVRIGNILLKTDVFPHNILCLTYTEAGVIAMRQRLNSFIGPDAYNVNIHTFHAFCNNVIKENIQHFGHFRDLQMISDIEEIEVFRAVIDKFDDDHQLKRFKGDISFETKRLKSLFSMMKQEKWDASAIRAAYEVHKTHITDPTVEGSDYVYKTKRFDKNTNTQYQKGDINPRLIKDELKRYEDVLAASQELDAYNTEMARRERFDYQDMILWVIEKFKTIPDLLSKYQERFQYILVDEYQDTNGAQNELIFLLADYWDQPNLFIVGDDDQSIFRFQGANMNSIIDFKDKFAPQEIVLSGNYRSSQNILDRARKLIEYNEDRLVRRYPYLTKDLTEKRLNGLSPAPVPEIIAYKNETQEEAGIISKILELQDRGTPLNKIAVIYSKHKFGDNLIKYFSQKNIPVNVKKRVNVLNENDVFRLTNILRYINGEFTKPHSSEDLLFEIMHYEYFGLSALDIASVSLLCRRKSDEKSETFLKWREVISNKDLLTRAGVKNINDVISFSDIMEAWISDISNVTIQTLIEKILTKGHILDVVLHGPDKAWKLQLINTFFDFVKNEAAKIKVLSLKELIRLLDILDENKLELPVNRVISNEQGLHFITAHGAKGLEFEHVFIMRANRDQWENKKGGNYNYSLPPTLSKSIAGGETEDDRRLMYVAITRAKNYLYISYPTHSDDEKELEPSRFISEVLSQENEVKHVEIPEEVSIEYKAELMRYQQGEARLIDDELIDKVLENFKISATSLNKYLKCKLAFYFENILRVPLGRSASMGFGNAIHYGLELFFADINQSIPRSIGSVSKLTDYFIKGMDNYKSHFTAQEFENYTKHGINVLTDYYTEYHNEWLAPRKYELEYNMPITEYQGVPISGKLDRINIYDDHISVTDYKTGKYDSKKLNEPSGGDDDLGGDYWRQIVFYRLLLDGDKRHDWVMNKGIMDFVEKDGKDIFRRKEFSIASFETEIVGKQLVDAYQNIKNHIFTPGCGDEKCQWCNFVMRNMPAKTTTDEEESEENLKMNIDI